MQELLSIIQNATPIGVIMILVIIIWQLLRGNGIMGKIRGTQVARTINEAVTLDLLGAKLDKIAGNHLHGLPDMEKSLERIESKQDRMVELLTQINTKIK